MIERNLDFYEDIDRGQGIYIIAYKDGKTSGDLLRRLFVRLRRGIREKRAYQTIVKLPLG